MPFNPEVNYGFDPDEEDRRMVTERPDGSTDEQDDAMTEAWLAEREGLIAGRLEQFKYAELREALENINEDVGSILERFGYKELSDEAMDDFRRMREQQIEAFYAEHGPELVDSIIGDLTVRGTSGSQEEFGRVNNDIE